jgi:hypothetical protein
MPDTRLVATHLNDHLALATAAVALARRASGAMAQRPWGPELTPLAAELEAERQAILALLRANGAGRDRLKELGGWAGEKVGRLKPNGRLKDRSPLSDVVELEALAMLVFALRGFWRGLAGAWEGDGRLAGLDVAARAEAANGRLDRLERARDRAATAALG